MLPQSPFTQSVIHVGAFDGAMIASSLSFFIAASIPSSRVNFKHNARASRYSFVVSGPFFAEVTKISCLKCGISRAALSLFRPRVFTPSVPARTTA